MKHTLPLLALGLAFAASPSVDAGTHTVEHVKITTASGWTIATGNVGDVYNSTSTVEMISCQVRGTNYVDASCFARTQSGQTLQCHTDKEPVLRVIMSIHQDSRVEFFPDEYGSCAGVWVTNGSLAAPKRTPVADFDPTAIDPDNIGFKQ